jgi:hypothetical protein
MPSRRTEKLKRRIGEYVFQCERCAVCWATKFAKGVRHEVHHIVGRWGGDRCHDHRNLILVCEECHRAYHAGISGRPLTLGHILKAKEEEDGEVDLEFLAGLKGRAGLKEDPTELPEWVHEERRRNAGQ